MGHTARLSLTCPLVPNQPGCCCCPTALPQSLALGHPAPAPSELCPVLLLPPGRGQPWSQSPEHPPKEPDS